MKIPAMNIKGKVWLLAELEKSLIECEYKVEAQQAAGQVRCRREEFCLWLPLHHILLSNFEGKLIPNIIYSIFEKFWCPSGIIDTPRTFKHLQPWGVFFLTKK